MFRAGETAAEELGYALRLLYGQIAEKMATRCLERCIKVVDRAVSEDKFQKNKRCKAGFPANLGRARRVRAYAQFMLGKKLDTQTLSSAADEIISYWKTWDDPLESQLQAFWLAAARMTLTAGLPAEAAEQIASAPSLKWRQREGDLLAHIAEPAKAGESIRNDRLPKRFDKLFDKVRSPKWRGAAKILDEPDMQRLELALIRCEYFTSTDGSIDRHQVIKNIIG